MRAWLLPLALTGLAVASCNGTTGDELITFNAYAVGTKGASEPFSINGYTIQLVYAHMHIGAVYVDEAPLATGAESPICLNPGVYAGQVPGGVEVDLLSSTPTIFSVPGNGTADVGHSWELWLTDGDVNNPNNSGYDTNGNLIPNTVDLQFTATRASDGAMFKVAATVTINQENRGAPVSDPSQPGLNPLCKQRIVYGGGIDVPLFADGELLVIIDPRGWFNIPINFSTLPLVSSDACELDQNPVFGDADYCIPDTSFGSGLGATQGSQMYTGIFNAGSAAYSLSFTKSQ